MNTLKEKIINTINKIRYYRMNKWIEANNINMLGKCYKFITEDYTMYTRIVSVNNNYEAKFIGLTYKVPKNIDNTGDTLVTNEYGPFITSDELPPYKDIFILFNSFDLDELEVCEEISKDEFTSNLTLLMDNILSIGY